MILSLDFRYNKIMSDEEKATYLVLMGWKYLDFFDAWIFLAINDSTSRQGMFSLNMAYEFETTGTYACVPSYKTIRKYINVE